MTVKKKYYFQSPRKYADVLGSISCPLNLQSDSLLVALQGLAQMTWLTSRPELWFSLLMRNESQHGMKGDYR